MPEGTPVLDMQRAFFAKLYQLARAKSPSRYFEVRVAAAVAGLQAKWFAEQTPDCNTIKLWGDTVASLPVTCVFPSGAPWPGTGCSAPCYCRTAR